VARRVSSRIVVTEADLLEALISVSTVPEDAKTVQQLAAETGLHKWRVQEALRSLHARGRLQAYRVPHIGIDGRRGMVPAYTIRPV
jgi:DNA-binding GntR family transcriptional regulator